MKFRLHNVLSKRSFNSSYILTHIFHSQWMNYRIQSNIEMCRSTAHFIYIMYQIPSNHKQLGMYQQTSIKKFVSCKSFYSYCKDYEVLQLKYPIKLRGFKLVYMSSISIIKKNHIISNRLRI